jgi:hypothetical protein
MTENAEQHSKPNSRSWSAIRKTAALDIGRVTEGGDCGFLLEKDKLFACLNLTDQELVIYIVLQPFSASSCLHRTSSFIYNLS